MFRLLNIVACLPGPSAWPLDKQSTFTSLTDFPRLPARPSCLPDEALHARAGIDDPYEAPEHAEITLDVDDPQGRRQSPEAMARIILAYLEVCPGGSTLHHFVSQILAQSCGRLLAVPVCRSHGLQDADMHTWAQL